MMSAAAPNTITVKRYDGRSPLADTATLIASGSTVRLIGTNIDQAYQTRQLRVSPRVGRAQRFITLPDGAQLQSPDHPLLDRLAQEGKTEGVVAWLEARWPVAVASVFLTLAALALGYVYGLPAAANHIAARVPLDYERQFGERTLHWLDGQKLFTASKIDPSRRERLSKGFARLAAGLPEAAYLRLEYRNAPGIGANAFALPGGIVVITDQMIDLAESPEEVYAVLAHEIGHVAKRHALRHIVQDSVTAAVATLFTSDVSSLTFAVSGIPVLLVQAKYSREFESEADAFAFDLLKKKGISPEYFADIMERLSAKRDPKAEGRMAFLSTHPVTAERIARARAAAQ